MNTFAQILRQERQRLQMSLAQFALLTGSSVASLKRWENGQTTPSEVRQDAIVRAINDQSSLAFSGFAPGWWLRIARHQQRRSIRSAAGAAGIAPSVWHRYETGEADVSLRTAFRLTAAIGLTPLATSTDPSPGLSALESQLCQVAGCFLELSEAAESPEMARDLAVAHFDLGALLLCIGEHSLAGQAFVEARRYYERRTYDFDFDEVNCRISAAWRGFGLETDDAARRRSDWIEEQMVKIPLAQVGGYSMPRAIYAERAGRIDLAAQVVRELRTNPTYEERHADYPLLAAWLQVKYGEPRTAIKHVLPLIDDPDRHVRASAHKTLCQAFWVLRDRPAAESQYQAMVKLQSTEGLRITGLPKGLGRSLRGDTSE